MVDGLTELARRVARLDAVPYNRGGGPLDDLAHFIEVVERITSAGTETDRRTLPHVSPTDADAILGRSHLLARVAGATPEIVAGPIRLDAQYWVSSGAPSWVPARAPILDETHFVDAAEAHEIELSTKPFRVGLFTSTGVLGTHGMWRLYLDLNRGSTLHPLPWHTWAVEPRSDVVVLEIASAAQWVDFVLSHPRRHEEEIYPDWKSVAQRHDAVHMTLRAIAATQGLYFRTNAGEVAPTFWGVESTFWLRWRFGSVRLVETVTESSGS